MAKLVETHYTGDNWRTGEEDVTRAIELALKDDEGNTLSHISFSEGEPEDMTFGRELSDAFVIADLVKKAYDLGRSGEDVRFTFETEEW